MIEIHESGSSAQISKSGKNHARQGLFSRFLAIFEKRLQMQQGHKGSPADKPSTTFTKTGAQEKQSSDAAFQPSSRGTTGINETPVERKKTQSHPIVLLHRETAEHGAQALGSITEAQQPATTTPAFKTSGMGELSKGDIVGRNELNPLPNPPMNLMIEKKDRSIPDQEPSTKHETIWKEAHRQWAIPAEKGPSLEIGSPSNPAQRIISPSVARHDPAPMFVQPTANQEETHSLLWASAPTAKNSEDPAMHRPTRTFVGPIPSQKLADSEPIQQEKGHAVMPESRLHARVKHSDTSIEARMEHTYVFGKKGEPDIHGKQWDPAVGIHPRTAASSHTQPHAWATSRSIEPFVGSFTFTQGETEQNFFQGHGRAGTSWLQMDDGRANALQQPASQAEFHTRFQGQLHSFKAAEAFTPMQAVRRIALAAAGGKQRIEIQLEPEHLGKIHLSMQNDAGKQLHVHMLVEHAWSRQVIEQHLPMLRQALSDQGFTLGNFHMDMGQEHAPGQQKANTSLEEGKMNVKKMAVEAANPRPTGPSVGRSPDGSRLSIHV